VGFWVLGVLAALGLFVAAAIYSERLWRFPERADTAGEASGRAERLEAGKTPSTPPRAAMPMPASAGSGGAAASTIPDLSSPLPATVEAVAEEMQQVARRLPADFPTHPEAMDQAAGVYFMFGQTAKAVDFWKKSLELKPNNADVYRRMASVATRKGDPQEAVRLLRRAMALDPRSFDNQFDLAEALMNLGQAGEAIPVLQSHVQTYPGSARGYVLLGAAHLRQNAFQEARQAYETAIKLDPDDDFPYSGLALVCARLGDREPSRRYREKSEQVRGRNRQVQLGRRQGYDDYETMCEAMARVYSNAGRLYYVERKAGEAERIWLRAAAVAPKNAASRAALAELYLKGNRKLADAVALARKAADLEPSGAHYGLLAMACRQSGDTAGALAALDLALRIDPGNLTYREAYRLLKEKK
jgi:tetratricopeptide (TPR) repeat protein